MRATVKRQGTSPRALAGDGDGARAGVHSQVGAAQLAREEPPWPGDAAAQVQHRDPGADAGLHRQGPDLARAHEALLPDELAGGVRRHARAVQCPVERRAIVLPHPPILANCRGPPCVRSRRRTHDFGEQTQAGPATGLLAQLLVLSALAETTGLGAAGWVVGVACAVTMAAALARGLARR